MRSVSYRLADLIKARIPIGFVGENEHTVVQFDAKQAFDQYPTATPSLTVKNPSGEKYPAVVVRDGDMVIWTISDSDMIVPGHGEFQLQFKEGDTVMRSYVGETRIERSIMPTGDVPTPVQNWIDVAEDVLEEVEEAIPAGGTTGQVLAKKSDADRDTEWVDQTGGGGGTTNYNALSNKPQIGGVTLSGDKSLHDLGIAAESAIPDVSGFYTKPASGIPASDIAEGVIPDPEDLIDDTAGDGDTDKVWSADKTAALSSAIMELEANTNTEEHKDGNYAIFDNGMPDSPIHAVSSFAYDSNGITSATLTKKGKNLAQVTRRSDLPSWNTGAYPGTVGGYGTAYVRIYGKKAIASLRFDVPDSDTTSRSLYVFYYNADKTLLGKTSKSTTGNARVYATIPAGAEYMVFRADGLDGLDVEGQIEFGDSMTEYEAYKGVNYTETFGVTIYGGYLDWNTGVLTSTLKADGSALSTPVQYELTPTDVKTFDGVTMLEPDKGVIEASSAIKIADMVEGIDNEIHPFGTIPGYWESGSGYLTGKVNTINTLARSCASDADIFYFITDVHWEKNQKHSPTIIEWMNKRINVPRMFCGGDNADTFDPATEVSRKLRYAMGNGEYYFVDGNHEYLQSKTYSDNFYAHREYMTKAVYGDALRTYYYVDNPATKMRYIILSTYGEWSGGSENPRLDDADQLSWFTNTALNVEDGWTVIVFAHIFSTYTGTFVAGTTNLISAMASMAHGEVACIIQGDQHHDYTLTVNNGAIPVVCTTCDKNIPVSYSTPDMEDSDARQTGTIKEQAFDVVVVDKTNKNVHFVRIGYAKTGAETRTVHYGGD